MKQYLLVAAILFFSFGCFAQQGSSKDSLTLVKVLDKFDTVEVESEFRGGVEGWIRFLTNHLKYPQKAVRNKIQGTVILQFIVEKDGVLSNMSVVSGPEMLQEAALDVIHQSPPWKPATKNGQPVRSYKKQPITFRLQ